MKKELENKELNGKKPLNIGGVSNSEFRIGEYSNHFRVARKEKVPEYWMLFGLYPLFVKSFSYNWYTVTKDGVRLSIHNWFNYDKFHFKTKEEALKWVKDFNKYPIYHYC